MELRTAANGALYAFLSGDPDPPLHLAPSDFPEGL